MQHEIKCAQSIGAYGWRGILVDYADKSVMSWDLPDLRCRYLAEDGASALERKT